MLAVWIRLVWSLTMNASGLWWFTPTVSSPSPPFSNFYWYDNSSTTACVKFHLSAENLLPCKGTCKRRTESRQLIVLPLKAHRAVLHRHRPFCPFSPCWPSWHSGLVHSGQVFVPEPYNSFLFVYLSKLLIKVIFTARTRYRLPSEWKSYTDYPLKSLLSP